MVPPGGQPNNSRPSWWVAIPTRLVHMFKWDHLFLSDDLTNMLAVTTPQLNPLLSLFTPTIADSNTPDAEATTLVWTCQT